ncbi:uncharacterized protein LOC135953451 [Calliphora vicina]|uniref:uncharacterized protein LOC135953451 n=1 Tax=Calliphora vicina TaxID=7373 RepID=UPI00325A8400
MFRLLFLIFTLTVTYVKSQYASPCLTTNQRPGLCMPVKSCKPIYDFFISHSDGIISEQDKLRLASLYCGTFKNVKHVCCGETDIQLNIDGLNILKNNTCGAYFVNSIANGEKASLFQYPWMVLLKYNDNASPFKCGGTLINDQYVLTAAHCIKGNEHELKQVRLGEYQISTTIDCTNVSRKNHCAPPVEDIGIEEMIIHEHFHGIYNDIALIRLNRKVEFKHTYSDVLLTAFVPRLNRSECENQFHNNRLPLNEGHVCAGGRNLVDTCRGDSGGPLGYRDLYDKRPRFIQFGIVSYGLHKCGVEPGVYTNISHYMQWITDNLKETSGIMSNQAAQSCSTPVMENGFCVPYNECPYANNLVNQYGSYNAIPKNDLNVLINSKCSGDNEPIRLCCKLSNTYVRKNKSLKVNPAKPDPTLTEDLDYNSNINSQFKSHEAQSCITPPMETGLCVPYNECPYANNLVKHYGSYDAIPKNDLNVLIKSKCSRDNEPIRLCCKFSNNYVPQNTQSKAITAKPDPTLTEDLDYNREFSSQFNSQGLNILAELSCGRSGGNRLAGGNEADLAEYPWMALLTYNEGSDQINCGGSLISNRYVLTATHCVNQATYQVIGVRLGEHDLSTNPDCRRKGWKYVCNPVVEDFGIEKIIPHPRYNERMRINDIALIKLDRDVDFKRHIKPVCLPIIKSSYEINTNQFTIAGWGVTENRTRSLVLLKAEVLRQSRSVCQYFYSPLSVKINEKHICAGNRQTGRDTCKGDSGGPLVAFNTYSNVKHFIQYGIVASGGTACNLQQGFPGVYTNVLTYLPWITHNIID